MMLTATSCPKCHFEFPLPLSSIPPPPAPRLCVCACACPTTSVPVGGVLSLSVSTCTWTSHVDQKQRLCPPPLNIPSTGKGRKDLMTGGGIIHVASSPQTMSSSTSTPSSPPSTPLSLAALSTSPVIIKAVSTTKPPVLPPLFPAGVPPVQLLPPPPVTGRPTPIQRTPFGGTGILQPDQELTMLKSTMRTLKMCGFYYERFSWQDSATALHQSAEGTFLVRDSSDPRFLFALSVQTVRGPTSVRLHYVSGGFRLDALPHLADDMPVFPCVIPLIEHYASKGVHQSDQVLVDAKSQVHSSIRLTVPRRTEPPTLQHLARLAINKSLRQDMSVTGAELVKRLDSLPLPHTVKEFMKDYPYTL